MHLIIQARMNSSRLPGKVLKKISGKPLLGWILARAKKAEELATIVVATSDKRSDDPIKAFCDESEIECYRGSLDNVAARFRGVVTEYGFDHFIRISGDSPLIDPSLITQAIRIYAAGKFDLVTNIAERTFPKGQSIEVVKSETFLHRVHYAKDDADAEHVTRRFYTNPKTYSLASFTSGSDYSSLQMSIDTAEDFVRLETLMASCDSENIGWEDAARKLSELSS